MDGGCAGPAGADRAQIAGASDTLSQKAQNSADFDLRQMNRGAVGGLSFL
jgi:hypothetical protein